MARKLGVGLPGTLERSPAKAQRTYAKTLEHAEGEYGKKNGPARAIAKKQK